MSKLPALIALTLVLAACGAGQTGTPNVAAWTAQVIIGTVTALSADHQALTVAGRALHLDLASQGLPRPSNGASIRVNRDDANELALSIGQHVMVQAKDDTAGEIDIEKELRGTVSSFDLKASTLVVNGQTVTVLPTTPIELSRKESSLQGLTHTLADLQIGVFVEVTGERNAPGGVTASSLDVRSAPEHHEQGQDDQAELQGTISGLDAAAKTLARTVHASCLQLPVHPGGAVPSFTLVVHRLDVRQELRIILSSFLPPCRHEENPTPIVR